MEEGEKLDAVWKKGPPSLPPSCCTAPPASVSSASQPSMAIYLGHRGKGKRGKYAQRKKVEKILFHLL